MLVQVLEGAGTRVARAARAAGDPITTLTAADFKVTVNGTSVAVEAKYDIGTSQYVLTSTSVRDWTAAGIKDVVVTVGTYSESYDKVAADDKIEDANASTTYTKGSGKDVILTPTLTNLTMADLEVANDTAKLAPVLNNDGTVTVSAAALDKQNAGNVTFDLQKRVILLRR